MKKSIPLEYFFNEEIYFVFDDGDFHVVRKSDGLVVARNASRFGWSRSLGKSFSNRDYDFKINLRSDKVVKIGK